jgi:Domain of unknown function (DUF1707)
MDDASLRVSDADRERAVVVLRQHLLAGRLTPDEFSERVEAVLRARVGTDLARVQEDLPAVAAEVAPSQRKPTRFTAAMLGHVTRRGRLRLRKRTVAAVALGDLDLDLREATIDLPQTAVTTLVAFGNADIYVPDGVNVLVGGFGIAGHRNEWGQDNDRPDAPTVHIRAFSLFGTVDVWRVPSDMQGGYGEIFRQLKDRQRQLPG